MKKTEKRLIAKVRTNDGSFGKPFHFFPHEEAEIQAHNCKYQQQTSATEVLLSYFSPAPRQAQYVMKAVDIQRELSRHLRSEDVPNIKQLTVTLKQCGFKNGSIRGNRGWYATRLIDPRV